MILKEQSEFFIANTIALKIDFLEIVIFSNITLNSASDDSDIKVFDTYCILVDTIMNNISGIVSSKDSIIKEESEEEEKPFFIWGSWSQNITSPLQMDFSQPGVISKIALGNSFSVIIDNQGTLWSWGYNEYGCMGILVDRKICKVPELVTFFEGKKENFEDVVVGNNHVLALTSEGKVYGWGDNGHCQVGVKKDKENTTLWVPYELTFPQGVIIHKIYASLDSSYAISDDGDVYAWGCNSSGQLGLSSLVDIELPKRIENLPQISALIIKGKQIIGLQVYNDFIEDPDDEYTEKFETKDAELKFYDSKKRDSKQLSKADLADFRKREPNILARKEIERNDARPSDLKSNSQKSVVSNKSNRSTSSRTSSRYKNQPTDKLGAVIKEAIPVVFELYEEFKKMDELIKKEFTNNLKEIRSNPAKNFITKLKSLREDCAGLFEKELNLEILNEDKENLETKKFVSVIRESLLDSLALRTIQVLTFWMQNYKDALELQSFIGITDRVEINYNMLIKEEIKRFASLYHCSKIRDKIKQNSKILKSMTLGLNNASCSAFTFILNSVLEQTQLWAGINNLTNDIYKLTKQDVEESSLKNFIKKLGDIHKTISEGSIDKIVSKFKYNPKKGTRMDYVNEIINLSETARLEGSKALEAIKDQSRNHFNKQAETVYHILVENIELREFLNELQRKTISYL
jgi:Regulator of chromosome condensation (RCC1) repeat